MRRKFAICNFQSTFLTQTIQVTLVFKQKADQKKKNLFLSFLFSILIATATVAGQTNFTFEKDDLNKYLWSSGLKFCKKKKRVNFLHKFFSVYLLCIIHSVDVQR